MRTAPGRAVVPRSASPHQRVSLPAVLVLAAHTLVAAVSNIALCRSFQPTPHNYNKPPPHRYGPAPARSSGNSLAPLPRAAAAAGRESAHQEALDYISRRQTQQRKRHPSDAAVSCDPTRRDALQAIVASSVLLSSTPSAASAAQTTSEAIRRSAANLPGYGQSDVYYPSTFEGRWKATRTIVVSDDPYLANLVSSQFPLIITYEVRFVPVDGDGKSGGGGSNIVADRAYNERSYYDAVRSAIAAAAAGGGGGAATTTAAVPAAIRSTDWDSSNPNVLTVSYVDGTSREVKVTKRAATMGQDGEGTVTSSEYRRVSDVGARGIPVLSGSRVMSKWRSTLGGEGEGGVTEVEGIEIVYSDAVMGDPMGGGGSSAGGPKVSSKARLRLVKI